jgi:hypothetical protein
VSLSAVGERERQGERTRHGARGVGVFAFSVGGFNYYEQFFLVAFRL